MTGTSGREGPVYDPATGQLTQHVDFASVDEVSAAVAAAKAAFPGWRATSLSKRTDIMFRIRNLVEAHRKEMAAHLTAEHGKVPSDALGEVARGIENLEFACGIPSLLKGGFSEQVSGGVDVYQIRQPLGVVAGITPFNFPAMVPMGLDQVPDLERGFVTGDVARHPACGLRRDGGETFSARRSRHALSAVCRGAVRGTLAPGRAGHGRTVRRSHD